MTDRDAQPLWMRVHGLPEATAPDVLLHPGPWKARAASSAPGFVRLPVTASHPAVRGVGKAAGPQGASLPYLPGRATAGHAPPWVVSKAEADKVGSGVVVGGVPGSQVQHRAFNRRGLSAAGADPKRPSVSDSRTTPPEQHPAALRPPCRPRTLCRNRLVQATKAEGTERASGPCAG